MSSPRKMHVVILGEKRWDLDKMRDECKSGSIAILSDVTYEISVATHRLSASLGGKMDDGSFLDRLISLDIAEVKGREIGEIMEFYERERNTTLAKLLYWKKCGVVYKQKRKGKADLWGVDYHQFARLTGLEIISY